MSIYRTATYWPPDSWGRGQSNVAVHIQALWTVEGSGGIEVFLKSDVAEGGYLFDGITYAEDPTKLHDAYKIELYLAQPDLRSLKMVRKAIVSCKAAA